MINSVSPQNNKRKNHHCETACLERFHNKRKLNHTRLRKHEQCFRD